MSIGTLQGQVRQQFIAKHGETMRHGGIFVFENGAYMEESAMGACFEPPEDDYQRMKLRVAFQREKLQREVKRFDETKTWCLRWKWSDTGGKRREEWLAELQQCRTVVNKHKKAVAELEAELLKVTPPGWLPPEGEDAATRDFKQQVHQIRV